MQWTERQKLQAFHAEAPVAAVREAIINSFGRKLFEARQANEVAVYRERIEIYSPGEFPQNHSRNHL